MGVGEAVMGGDPVPGHNDRLREMLEKAESQTLKDGYRDSPKRKWLKTKCPKCGYRIQYDPKPDWSGELRCPDCGRIFKVPRLDTYLEEEKGGMEK